MAWYNKFPTNYKFNISWKRKTKDVKKRVKKQAKKICVNKFFFANVMKGVNRIIIRPLKLVIKKRGNLKTFSQKISIT